MRLGVLRSRRTAGLLGLVLLVDTAFALMFLAAIQEYVPADLDGNPAIVGYTLAAFGLVKLCLQTFCGIAVDRFSARSTAIAGLALSLAAALLMATVQRPGLFPVFGGLYGAGSALLWPALYSIAASSTEASGRSQMTAALAVTTGAAVAIAVVGGSLLVDLVSGRSAVLAAAGLAVAAALLAPVLLSGHGGVASAGSEHEPAERFEPARLVSARFALGGIVLAQGAAAAGLVPVIGGFAREELGIEFHRAVLSLAPAGVAGVAGLLLGTRLAPRLGRHMVAAGGATIAASGAALLAVSPTIPTAVGSASLLAFGYAALFPAVSGLVMDLSRSPRRGTLIGWYMAVEGAGHALGPALSGFALGVADPQAAVLCAAVLLGVASASAVGLVVFATGGLRARGGTRYGFEPTRGVGG